MTSDMTHGFDLVVEIAEPIVNTMVGLSAALPSELDIPFEGDVGPGIRAAGMATFHLESPLIVPDTVRLDTHFSNGILLDVAFYNSSITFTHPEAHTITNLAGRIFIIALIDAVPQVDAPNRRLIAAHTFLPSAVIPEGGSAVHIEDSGIGDIRAVQLLSLIAHHIDDYLAALTAGTGYLPLHSNGIPVSPGSTHFLEPQDIDICVANESGLDERDALALLVTTLGSGGTPGAFTEDSFLRPGENTAAIVSNYLLLRHVIRPRIISAIGMPPGEVGRHFDPGQPCHLTEPWESEFTFDELGIPVINGLVILTYDEIEVSADDGGFFNLLLDIRVDVWVTPPGSSFRVGDVTGVLTGMLFLDLTGDTMMPRLEFERDITASADRASLAELRAALFWLGLPLWLFYLGLVLRRIRQYAEGEMGRRFDEIEAELNGALPTINLPDLYTWLRPFGYGYTPEEIIIDDIAIYGNLDRTVVLLPAARAETGIDLSSGWGFDLDNDAMLEPGTVDPTITPDFLWDRWAGKECIITANGASLAYLGDRVAYDLIDRTVLESLHYEEESTVREAMLPIVPDDQSLNIQTGGVVFAMITSDGRYAKVRICPMRESYTNLVFDYAIYD